jgi:hypothetical protein
MVIAKTKPLELSLIVLAGLIVPAIRALLACASNGIFSDANVQEISGLGSFSPRGAFSVSLSQDVDA